MYPTNWNFSLLTDTPTPEYWTKERKRANKIFSDFANKWTLNQNYLTDPKTLREALDEYEKIQSWLWWVWSWDDFWVIWTESFYYRLKCSLCSDDLDSLAKSNQADDFATNLANKILFFEISLAKISEENQKKFLNDPILDPYYHYLEKIFLSSKHNLSPNEEKILNLFSKTSYENRYQMTSRSISSALIDFNFSDWTKKITFEELSTLTHDNNESIRIQAAKLMDELLFSKREMAENEMNSLLWYKKTIDELRWYNDAEEFLTVRDDISLETIHTMLDCVKENYDFSHDYYKLKAKLLWKEKLTYSEKNISCGYIDKNYTFDEAVDIVRMTLWKWDDELLQIFNDSLNQWRIDVLPWKWKRGWAFCTDSSLWMPVYILLNYTNKLDDVSTLIHESWHNACNMLMKKNLNWLQYWCTLAVAETPSTFYESLLADSIEKSLTWDELLIYRMNILDSIVSTVSRQVAEYFFEQELHQKFRKSWYLNADEIWKIFSKNMKDYLWDSIDFSELDANKWIHWHHNRMFFYVYSYASWYLISQAILKKLKNWSLNIWQVKEFFAAWFSMKPEKIFQRMWIDINNKEFWIDAISQIKEYLRDTEELARQLWKI